jgi:hypothetical protein
VGRWTERKTEGWGGGGGARGGSPETWAARPGRAGGANSRRPGARIRNDPSLPDPSPSQTTGIRQERLLGTLRWRRGGGRGGAVGSLGALLQSAPCPLCTAGLQRSGRSSRDLIDDDDGVGLGEEQRFLGQDDLALLRHA